MPIHVPNRHMVAEMTTRRSSKPKPKRSCAIMTAVPSTTSAADLKSLHHLLQTRVRDFKSISGTRIIWLLVPFCFRSSFQRLQQRRTNFEKRALALSRRGGEGDSRGLVLEVEGQPLGAKARSVDPRGDFLLGVGRDAKLRADAPVRRQHRAGEPGKSGDEKSVGPCVAQQRQRVRNRAHSGRD